MSLLNDGASRGTYGSSNHVSRGLDAIEFTFGQGPCQDAVRQSRVILVDDLNSRAELQWPAFVNSARELDVGAVFALPVAVDGTHCGALCLYRHTPGPLPEHSLAARLLAAIAAEIPLLQIVGQPLRL